MREVAINSSSKFASRLYADVSTPAIVYSMEVDSEGGPRVRCSIRGKDGGDFTALDVAKEFGGGGQTNSAGFRLNTLDFYKTINDMGA